MNTSDDDTAVSDEQLQAQLADPRYARLQQVLSEYREESTPALEDAPQLRSRIMELIRSEYFSGPSTQLQTPSGVPYQLTTAYLRSHVREVIDEHPGIQARRVRIEVDEAEAAVESGEVATEDPQVAADTAGFSVTVQASFTMNATVKLPELLPVLQEDIAQRLRSRFDITAAAINMTVEDVFDDHH